MGLSTGWHGACPGIFLDFGKLRLPLPRSRTPVISTEHAGQRAKVLFRSGIWIFGLHRTYEEVSLKTGAYKGKGRGLTVAFKFVLFRGNPRILGCPGESGLGIALVGTGQRFSPPGWNSLFGSVPS